MSSEESAELLLTTGQRLFIRVEYYKNSSEIRSLLKKISEVLPDNGPVNIEQLTYLPEVKKSEIFSGDYFVKYSGNPWLSLKALLFYGLCIGLFCLQGLPSKFILNASQS
jgi:hypothetical protein